jgi:hypothetical protein
MKTTIYFKMQKSGETEKVIFSGDPTISEITEYFENACGGVYRWWV